MSQLDFSNQLGFNVKAKNLLVFQGAAKTLPLRTQRNRRLYWTRLESEPEISIVETSEGHKI